MLSNVEWFRIAAGVFQLPEWLYPRLRALETKALGALGCVI
jgi:hypothetical protein